MARPPHPVLVASPEEARSNVLRFTAEADTSRELQSRLGRMHVWYAVRTPQGGWAFGSSKFVGYRDNSAERYLESSLASADGRDTEAVLKRWFADIDLGTAIGRRVAADLTRFLARWGVEPRSPVRIRALATDLDDLGLRNVGASGRSLDDLRARVTSDPQVCGGRPCIRGTRMRVSDIISMMAAGASRSDILADYPYLAEDDLAAALAFAAQAIDHRVIRVA